MMFRAIIFLIFLAAVQAAAASEVRPPFGLSWGETPDKLETLLKGAGAKIVNKSKRADLDIWTVEGLLQPRLRRTLFHFSDGSLVEIELQYEDATWDVARYDAFLGEVRSKIEQMYGPGTLIARQKTPGGEVTEVVVGYQWQLTNGSLQLFYFSAEKGENVFRTVSVHYKST